MWQSIDYLKKFKGIKPWHCSLCEKDGYLVTPNDKYIYYTKITWIPELNFPDKREDFRLCIDICPRCKRELYGGFDKHMGNGRWESVCPDEHGIYADKKFFGWKIKETKHFN